MICGKPAVYFGLLDVTTQESVYASATAPRRYQKGPIAFCKDCTHTSPDPRFWLRQFISERQALPGEKCGAETLS